DGVALGVFEIHRGTVALGAIAADHLAGCHRLRFEVGADGRTIQPFHAQADMIHVAALASGRRPAQPPEFAGDVDEIDQRAAGAQLRQADLRLQLLDRAAEHVTVEALHARDVTHAQYHMIDTQDDDGSVLRHGRHPQADEMYRRYSGRGPGPQAFRRLTG